MATRYYTQYRDDRIYELLRQGKCPKEVVLELKLSTVDVVYKSIARARDAKELAVLAALENREPPTAFPEYDVWVGMIQRCHNPKAQAFHYYGAKGVKVCKRWRAGFKHFIDDMGRRPSNKHSIDRINPFGNYTPGNCRWVTADIQGKNRRASYLPNNAVTNPS